MNLAVEIRGLSFRYPEYSNLPSGRLFRGLDLRLAPGEVCLLLGRPDAGKSTLCRILAGLVPRFSGGELTGEVLLRGRSVRDSSPFERVRDVGLVFQNPAEQFFTERCDAEAAFALESLGLPPARIRARIGAALRAARLEGRRDPQTLSGGEKKKLALACLQAADPAVWVLDETLEELDAGTKLRLLDSWRAPGRTVLITSAKWHELFAGRVDRCLLLDRGRLREVRPGGTAFRELLRRQGFELGERRPPRRRAPVPVLEAEDLRFRYAGADGFQLRVDRLAVPRGGTLAVVGDNGSGKSTLAKILCGLLAPQAGRVRLAPDPAHADPQTLNLRVAYIFQDPDLQIFLPTVEEELAYGLKQRGLAAEEVQERVRSAARSFRLPGLSAPPALLSFGARKRLQAAVYHLLARPVVIFDEGDSGLGAAEFARLLGRFRSAARGLVVITHDLRLAEHVADVTVRLREGRLT